MVRYKLGRLFIIPLLEVLSETQVVMVLLLLKLIVGSRQYIISRNSIADSIQQSQSARSCLSKILRG